jgi:uncharacterized membrane protein
MADSKFSIGDAVNFSWDAMKNNLGFFLPAVLIIWFAGAIPSFFQSLSVYMGTALAAIWSLFFGLVGFVVGIFINMAQIRIGVKFCDGEVADFPDMVSDYQRFLDFLVGSILYFLIVLGGLILLIIPGIYWAVRYHFFGYLILDQGMSPVDAIKKSGQITRGSWWHLFVFALAMFGISLLGILACCVGLLFAIPVIIVSTAYVYRSLLAAAPAVVEPQPSPPPVPQQPPAAQ